MPFRLARFFKRIWSVQDWDILKITHSDSQTFATWACISPASSFLFPPNLLFSRCPVFSEPRESRSALDAYDPHGLNDDLVAMLISWVLVVCFMMFLECTCRIRSSERTTFDGAKAQGPKVIDSTWPRLLEAGEVKARPAECQHGRGARADAKPGMSLLDVVQSTAQLNILGSRSSGNVPAEELEVEAECQRRFIKTLQESFSVISGIPDMLVVLQHRRISSTRPAKTCSLPKLNWSGSSRKVRRSKLPEDSSSRRFSPDTIWQVNIQQRPFCSVYFLDVCQGCRARPFFTRVCCNSWKTGKGGGNLLPAQSSARGQP